MPSGPEDPAGPGPAPGAVAALLDRCAAAGLTVATAESLTAGQVSAALAGAPGASRVLRGGVVAYATAVKAELLGVDAGLLARRGPVDGGVAGQMARGARVLLGADLGASTTGAAGPDPQGGAAVGTVFVAVSWDEEAHPHVEVEGGGGGVVVRALHLPGDRDAVRAGACGAALDLLAEVVTGLTGPAAGPGGRGGPRPAERGGPAER